MLPSVPSGDGSIGAGSIVGSSTASLITMLVSFDYWIASKRRNAWGVVAHHRPSSGGGQGPSPISS